MYYRGRNKHNKHKGFDNAEEVWFCNIIDNQAGGLRSRTDYPGEPRVCEISDIYLILKKNAYTR